MSTLDRYILRRIAIASLGSFAAILAIVWVTQAMMWLDLATGTRQSSTTFLHMMTMLTPQYITITLPFGVLFGIVQVFNALNTDGEMPVIAGSGVSRARVLKPVLIFATLCSLALLFSSHFFEPYGNRKARDIITESRANFLTNLINVGEFNRAQRGIVIYVDGKTEGGALEGLIISDTRDQATHLLYYAREAILNETDDQSLLILADGEIHRKDTKSGNVSIIRYTSYAFDLAQFSSTTGDPVYRYNERSTADLMAPDADDPMFKKHPGQALGEVMKRFSDWLFPLLYACVAMVVAGQARTSRQSSIVPGTLAFLAALVYRWASYYIYNITKVDGSLAILLVIIPVLGIIVSIWMYLTGKTVTIPDFIVAFFERLTARFTRPNGAATAGAR